MAYRFDLLIEGEGRAFSPSRARLYVESYMKDSEGRVFITPECRTVDEVKDQVKLLKEALDELAAKAEERWPE